MNRRRFLSGLGQVGAAGLIGAPGVSPAKTTQPVRHVGEFTFTFFTDTHIQPELDAAKGCGLCFQSFHALPADFAVCGGDLVFDAAAVSPARADSLFDLYKQTSAAIPYPVHYAIGNHDIFGVLNKDGVAPADPQYGKKAFEDRYGPTRYSFAHKGWHFIVLDSICLHPDRTWTGQIGEEQIAWFKEELGAAGKSAPIVVVTHVPLVTGAISYVSHREWLSRTANLGGLIDSLMVTDASAVIDAMLGYNVRAVLQGHTHVNEDITFRGLRFITSGAVCGNWWKGVRAGSAEGFTTLRCTREGQLEPRYHTYGFHSVA